MSDRKVRGWPLLVVTASGTIHISRANAPSCKVCTECGRETSYQGTYSGSPEQIRKADGRKVEGRWEWENDMKLCSRCGTVEEFALALEESRRALKENEKKRGERVDRINEATEKAMAATRATIAAEVLYGVQGVDDVVHENWGIKFTLNGKRLELRLDEKEAETIVDKIYEEN
jgi:hypothetical protein